MKDFKDVRGILVVNLGGIGDALLSAPALKALRKFFPQARIVFLGVKRVCDVVRNFPFIDEAVPFSGYSEEEGRFSLARSSAVLKLLMCLRQKKFDLLLNMRTLVSYFSALKMALVFWVIGARYRLGRDTSGRGFFLNIKVPESDEGDRHEMEYDLETVAALGADISDRSFDEKIFGADFTQYDTVFAKYGLQPTAALIGVNPGGPPARRWPKENFRAVVEALLERYDRHTILIFGGPQEKDILAGLKSADNPRVVNLAGRLTFKELALFIKKCRLFITNDTGPMHIAAILGVPMVAVFGPGFLKRFDPRKINERAIVLYQKADCAPCNRIECLSLKCLKNIKTQDVLDAVFSLMRPQLTEP